MKYVTFLLFLLSTTIVFSQTPDVFSYRAVIMGLDSVPLKSQPIKVDIKIQDSDTDEAKIEYEETHDLVTNDRGGYHLKIGDGKGNKKKTLSGVDWSDGEKLLSVQVFDEDGNLLSQGVSQLMSVPYALFAKEVEKGNKAVVDCYANVDALRAENTYIDGDVVCINSHTSIGDGGGGLFHFKADYEYEENSGDDQGIIIKPDNIKDPTKSGRWLRLIDGYINVKYYGVKSGDAETDTAEKIQRAIDFASKNRWDDEVNGTGSSSTITVGNTVFFPNGQYVLSEPIVLKDGTALLGSGYQTFLWAKSDAKLDYLVKMAPGRVICHMEKFVLFGNNFHSQAGGMYLKAEYDPAVGLGGMSRSTFKDIEIFAVNGHGLVLEAVSPGNGILSVDNQFNVFENVQIRRKGSGKNSLLLKGAATENVFIECLFEGDRSSFLNQGVPSTGANVRMESIINPDNSLSRSTGLSFINCGFGLSEHGIEMIEAENITLDTCWFENLYSAAELDDSVKISIVGSRFANACGYGSEPPGGAEVPGGRCIRSTGTSVSVERNYVTVSNLMNPNGAFNANFIEGKLSPAVLGGYINKNTIQAQNNTFRDWRLAKTEVPIHNVKVLSKAIKIDGKKRPYIDYVGGTTIESTVELDRIDSWVSGGEVIHIRPNRTSGLGFLVLKDWSTSTIIGANINLGGLVTEVKLRNGQWATLMKVDNPVSTSQQFTYQLISVSE